MTPSQKTKIISKLKLLGYNLEVVDKYIKVKLPLSCSVNISGDGEVLKVEPRVGAMSRTNSTILTYFLSIGVIMVGLLFFIDDLKFLYFWGLAILLWGFWDVYRYILTESFISRFQLLILEMEKDTAQS